MDEKADSDHAHDLDQENHDANELLLFLAS
jgi:hypothetical protein